MPLPTKVPKLRRPIARLQVYKQLREWIEEGVLTPGEVIKDVDIAERLGVSRTPVREALQVLEYVGLIEAKPGRHTRVAIANPGEATLIYVPLGALHGVAAQLAAPRATDGDLDTMAAANERMLAAATSGNPDAAREADEAFHQVLVRRANNPYLSNVTASLEVHARRLETLYFSHMAPTRESYEDHKRILEALRRRDASLLRTLVENNYLRGTTIPEVVARDGPVNERGKSL